MYRVELKDIVGSSSLISILSFLMYRVELKEEPKEAKENPNPVPNVPCGVERHRAQTQGRPRV